MADYEQKLQLSRGVEEEIKNVTRDHETALHFYNDPSHRKNEAACRLHWSNENRRNDFAFSILRTFLTSPEFPKLTLFLASGLAAGSVLGWLGWKIEPLTDGKLDKSATLTLKGIVHRK